MGAFLSALLSLIESPATAPPTLAPTFAYGFQVWVTRTYGSFELEVKCDSFAGFGYTTRFSYELMGFDPPSISTELSTFEYDDTLAQNCQQKILSSYSPECDDLSNLRCFDSGYLVSPSYMDNDSSDIKEANYITNILPLAAAFYRRGGAWNQTEEIISCARTMNNVQRQTIFGGPIFTSDSNDYFLGSHGIPTPDEFWKVVIRYFNNESPPEVVAWRMPNEFTSTKDKLDEFVVTIKELKSITFDEMPELPTSYIEKKSSWPLECVTVMNYEG